MGSKHLSTDIRQKIIDSLQKGNSYRQTARNLAVGEASVNRVWRRFRQTGSAQRPIRAGGTKAKIPPSQEPKFIKMMEQNPSLTLDELAVEWYRRAKVRLSRTSVLRKLQKLGFSSKKKTVRANERLSDKNRSKRSLFRFRRKTIPASKLVFLDETGFQAKEARDRAWAPVASRAVVFETVRPSKNITGVGAIRLTGPVCFQGSDKNMTRKRFCSFLSTKLLPRLCPGDVLVLDNLSSHRGKEVRRLCRSWDIRLFYLPPYSPEYNPIENVWSWMKRSLRSRLNRASRCFRYAISGAWRKTANLSMQNLFRAAGYLPSCQAI